jgi:hypothetical protein
VGVEGFITIAPARLQYQHIEQPLSNRLAGVERSVGVCCVLDWTGSGIQLVPWSVREGSMTRTELKEWWMKETNHCKTFDEIADETVRFITIHFKKRAVAVVVDDPPPVKKTTVKKVIKRKP